MDMLTNVREWLAENEQDYIVGRYYVMPRNPAASGLEFQSSVYRLWDYCHEMICETYTMQGAELIAKALNEQLDVTTPTHTQHEIGDS